MRKPRRPTRKICCSSIVAAAHDDKKIENLFKEYVKKHIDKKFSGNFYSGITLLKKKIDYSYHDCKETRDEILVHALDVYMAVYVEFDGEKCYYRVIVYSPTKGFQKSTFRHDIIIDKTGKYKKYIPDANLSYQLVESRNYINTTRIISEASKELTKSTGDSSLRSTYIFYW